jgi:hypothetical protein
MNTFFTTRGGRAIAGLIMIALPAVALAGSAVAKFARIPAVEVQMARLGFAGDKLVLIAILEIVGAAAFLWPRTRSVGLLWVSSYLGGAICAHIQAGEFDKAASPGLLLAVAWIGTWLRHPQMLWSVGGEGDGSRGGKRTEPA